MVLFTKPFFHVFRVKLVVSLLTFILRDTVIHPVYGWQPVFARHFYKIVIIAIKHMRYSFRMGFIKERFLQIRMPAQHYVHRVIRMLAVDNLQEVCSLLAMRAGKAHKSYKMLAFS